MGCDAVMSSEALLETPSLFSNTQRWQDQLTLEYLDYCETYKCLDTKKVKAHLFRFLYAGLQYNTDLRSRLGTSRSFEEMREVANTLRERRLEKETFPFLSFPFLSFPFLSFPFLSFPSNSFLSPSNFSS